MAAYPCSPIHSDMNVDVYQLVLPTSTPGQGITVKVYRACFTSLVGAFPSSSPRTSPPSNSRPASSVPSSSTLPPV